MDGGSAVGILGTGGDAMFGTVPTTGQGICTRVLPLQCSPQQSVPREYINLDLSWPAVGRVCGDGWILREATVPGVLRSPTDP